MDEVQAKLKYLRVSPKKVRRIASLIRGISYPEALVQLKYFPQRSAQPLYKLLRSAGANAKQNKHLDPNSLLIKQLLVDPGPSYKRMRERAHGAGFPITKRMSHVTVVLGRAKGKLSGSVVTPAAAEILTPKPRKGISRRQTRSPRTRISQKERAVSAARRERVFRRKAI